MNKKGISLLLLVAMSTGIVGCGENNKVEDVPKTTAPIEESKEQPTETTETGETETPTEVESDDDSSSYVGMGGGNQWVSEYKDVTHKTSTKGVKSTSEKALKLNDIGVTGEYGTDYDIIQCFDVQVTKVILGDSARKLIEKDKVDFPKPRVVGDLESDDYEYVIVEYNKMIPSDYEVDKNILVNRYTDTLVKYVDAEGEKLIEAFGLGNRELKNLNAGEEASNQIAFILPKDCKEFSLRLGSQSCQTSYYNLTK